MKIVVNDIAVTPDAGGVFSVLKDLYQDAIKDTNTWIFILSGAFFKNTSNVKIIVRNDLKNNAFKKTFFELFTGRKFINKFQPDIYVSMQNIGTVGINAEKKITYLHQPLPFQRSKKFSLFRKGEGKLFYYQYVVGFIIKLSLKISKPLVIVQTEWMKEELIRRRIVSDEKIYVSHPIINVGSDRKVYDGLGNNFFYPASPYMYKNHEVIVKACQILKKNHYKNFKVDLTIKKEDLINYSKYKMDLNNSCINFIGHLDREIVMKKYEQSVLIFPSYIETYGLPLVEAASKADLIFAADTQFAHELLADYENVYFFEFDDAIALASLMAKSITGTIKAVKNKLFIETNNQERIIDALLKVSKHE